MLSLTADVVAHLLELGVFDSHCSVGVWKDLVSSAERIVRIGVKKRMQLAGSYERKEPTSVSYYLPFRVAKDSTFNRRSVTWISTSKRPGSALQYTIRGTETLET